MDQAYTTIPGQCRKSTDSGKGTQSRSSAFSFSNHGAKFLSPHGCKARAQKQAELDFPRRGGKDAGASEPPACRSRANWRASLRDPGPGASAAVTHLAAAVQTLLGVAVRLLGAKVPQQLWDLGVGPVHSAIHGRIANVHACLGVSSGMQQVLHHFRALRLDCQVKGAPATT